MKYALALATALFATGGITLNAGETIAAPRSFFGLNLQQDHKDFLVANSNWKTALLMVIPLAWATGYCGYHAGKKFESFMKKIYKPKTKSFATFMKEGFNKSMIAAIGGIGQYFFLTKILGLNEPKA